MEDRQAQPAPITARQYPPLPPGAQAKPVLKRPAAVVNKQAVARVQAQQAAMKTKAGQQSGSTQQDMQSLGEGLGSAVRTFRDAAADIQNSIDPQMRTIQAELQSAEKEMQDSIETAKQPLSSKEPSGSAYPFLAIILYHNCHLDSLRPWVYRMRQRIPFSSTRKSF